jgi:hypothetical protein
MEKVDLEETLRAAEEIAQCVSAPYRVPAFEVAARALLLDEKGRRTAAGVSNISGQEAGVVAANGDVPESVNEMLAQIRSRPHTDRFEAVVFHGLKRQGLESVTTDDILAAYSATRMSRPVNASDVIAKCFRKGHITEGERRDGQRTWRLTGSGERYVEQLLQDRDSE